MSNVLILLRKDCQTFLQDRVAVALTFLLPLVLIFIFGQAFGIGKSNPGPTGIALPVVRQNTDPAFDRLIAALEAEPAFRVRTTYKDDAGAEQPYTEGRLREDLAQNRVRFGLILPADQLTVDHPGVRLRLLLNPRNDIETQTVTGLLQKTIFTGAPGLMARSMRLRAQGFLGEAGVGEFFDEIAQAVGTAFEVDPAEIRSQMDLDRWFDEMTGSLDELAAGGTEGDGSRSVFDAILAFEKEPVTGLNLSNQSATRVVGGWAIMFLLFSITGAAASLFDERKAGLFLRLLSYPVRRSHILWSKYLFYIGLGMVQLGGVFVYAWVLYRIELWQNLGPLLAVCLFASAACTSFGMFIAAVSRTPAVANGLGTFLILTMSALGGAWFPITFMPEFMQRIAQLTLVYWAQEGFLRVLFQGESLVQVLPVLGVLGLIAAVLSGISLWRFRTGEIFG